MIDDLPVCRQCFHEYDVPVPPATDDGFCSDHCEKLHEAQATGTVCPNCGDPVDVPGRFCDRECEQDYR